MDMEKMKTQMSNTDQVLNKALAFYGRREQEIKVCEELGELQQAVFKSLKGTPSKENLTEEIADVLITIEYIKKIHNIKDEDIEFLKNGKIIRLMEKINAEEYNLYPEPEY